MNWYVKRILTFSPFEFIYRLKQYVRQNFVDRLKSSSIRYNGTFSTNAIASFRDEFFKDLKYIETFPLFNQTFQTCDIKNWHFDAYSGNTFPIWFYKKINIRSPLLGSAKHVWEVNRMLFLPHLAIAFRKTKENKYKEEIFSLISSWKDQNPYLRGVNWYSNIEVNIRLINWVWTWEILDGDALINTDNDFREFAKAIWIPMIYKHCCYSYENPSHFSSANNHLISEYAGLFIAASKWNFPESKMWLNYGKLGLEKEILRQHSVNGINKEEASEYIQFITDFFILAYIISEKTNNNFSKVFVERLKNILCYINDLVDTKGNYFRYGDDDDGRVILLNNTIHDNNFISLLQTSDILFKTHFSLKFETEIDQKNIILLCPESVLSLNNIKKTSDSRTSAFYREEGHFFLRTYTEKKEFLEMHFDAAPLGFLSIAAHGHSDALAIQLRLNGQNVLTDSGTFCYHTDPSWRAYFTSSIAHNTATINNKNQATYIGPTLWLNHYNCKIEKAEENAEIIEITASHNGYKANGITHSRTILYKKNVFAVEIIDTFTSTGEKTNLISIPFHFHPHTHVELVGNEMVATLPDKNKIHFLLDPKLDSTLYYGSLDPICGWYSNSFYSKTQCYCVLGKLSFQKEFQLKTLITYLP